MKLTLRPSALQHALATVAKSAASTSNLPILANALLVTDGDRLTVSATDLNTRIETSVEATVEEAGETTLPIQELQGVLEVCIASETLAISVNDKHRAALTCGAVKATLVGLSAEEFPAAPQIEGASCVINGATLRGGLGCVLHAVLTKEGNRPALEGVAFIVQDGTLTLQTADGFRMAIWKTEVDGDDLTMIVPARGLSKITGALAFDEPVTVTISGGMVRITTPLLTWSSRLIEAVPPDFSRFMNKPYPVIATCSREALGKAIKLAKAIGSQTGNGGARVNFVYLDIEGDQMRVDVRDLDGHSGSVDLPVEIEHGDGIGIAFNALYLADAVNAIDDERVTLELALPPSRDGIITGGMPIIRAPGPRNGHIQGVVSVSMERNWVGQRSTVGAS